MSDHEDTWGLVLPFDSDDPEFARGVEVGMLYEQLHADPAPQRRLVNARNAEMALRLAEAEKRTVRTYWSDEFWMDTDFGPRGGITNE